MILVMQQGGSTFEFYAHLFDHMRDAEHYRKGARHATYETSEPIKIPEALARVLRANPTAETAFVELLSGIPLEVKEML